MAKKLGISSSNVQNDDTLQAINNYQLAYADTLSIDSLTAIRAISQQTRNPALVSELSNGIGDTTVSALSNSEAQTISLDSPTPSQKKTVANNTSVSNTSGNKSSQHKPQKVLQPAEIQASAPPAELSSTLALAQEETDTNQNIHHSNSQIEEEETLVQNVPKRSSSSEINIGSILANRYEILSKIAEGGYGVVYKARQIGIDRIVAVKRLKRKHDKSASQRFLYEANVIKDLIHPNTIQLIDAGVDKNHPYIAMEYIEGITLKTLIKQEQLSTKRVINITKQILKSLNEAHERGIIHRDIKPSNILIRQIIGEKDFVKVLDFGIAKSILQNAPRLTQDGKILGTPQYIAPELLFGETPTPAVDIFAVGLMLTEMLTGTPVMPQSPAGVVLIATSDNPINIPESAVNSELGAIIQRAVDKNPLKRYSNAGEMLAELERVELRFSYCQSQFNTSEYELQKRKQNNTIYIIAIAAMLFIIANFVVLFHMFG